MPKKMIPLSSVVDLYGNNKTAEMFDLDRGTMSRWMKSGRGVVVVMDGEDFVEVFEKKVYWPKEA